MRPGDEVTKQDTSPGRKPGALSLVSRARLDSPFPVAVSSTLAILSYDSQGVRMRECPSDEGDKARAAPRDNLASDLNDQVLRTWDLYLKFYTVFLVFNATAIGYLVTREGVQTGRGVLAALFVAQNAIALVTAAMMSRYTLRTGKKLTQLGAQPLTDFTNLGVWGGIGNAIGHVVMSAIWIIVASNP